MRVIKFRAHSSKQSTCQTRAQKLHVTKFRTAHYALSTKLMQLCYMYASRVTPSRPPAHHCGGAERRRSGGRGGRASRCMATCKLTMHTCTAYVRRE